MADTVEQLLQAIDTVVSKRIEAISFDKTIHCTITDNERAEEGIYQVTDGSVKFIAYSPSTKYKVDDVVYVTIPQGDYNNQKIIVGKQVTSSNDSFIVTSPWETMACTTDNLITVNPGVVSLIANDPETTRQLVWSQNYSNVPLTGYDKLGIQAQFKSWIDECVTGDYGLELIITTRQEQSALVETIYPEAWDILNKQSLPTQQEWLNLLGLHLDIEIVDWNIFNAYTDTQKRNYINLLKNALMVVYNLSGTYKFTLSSYDMLGNPYDFDSYYQQEQVFALDPEWQITGMQLVFYQKPCAQPHNNKDEGFHDKLGASYPYADVFGNLFVKDPFVGLGYDLASFSGDKLLISCLDSHKYHRDIKITDEDNRKHLVARWVHRTEKKVVSLDTIAGYDAKIKWYKYKLGSPSPDAYAGVDWELVAENTFTYSFIPNRNSSNESVKAILFYDNSVFRSEIIDFTNSVEVENEATLLKVSAAQIYCVDKSFGNYFIYTQSGALIDSSVRNEIKTFECKFDIQNTGQAASVLNEAQSIKWYFSANNSMIKATDVNGTPLNYLNIKSNYVGELNRLKLTDWNYGDYSGDCYTYYDEARQAIVVEYFASPMNERSICPEQKYTIASTYTATMTANTVVCEILRDQVSYVASKECSFGVAGTSGTDYTFVLDFEDNKTAFTLNGTEKLLVKPHLYDNAGKEQDFGDKKLTWEWFVESGKVLAANGVEDNSNWLIFTEVLGLPNTMEIKKDESVTGTPTMNSFYILQCTIEDWGDYPLTAFLPIPIRLNNSVLCLTGATLVVYPSMGDAEYYRDPYRLWANYPDEEIEDCKWSIFNALNEDPNYIGVLSVNALTKEVADHPTLKPTSVYIEGAKQYGIQARRIVDNVEQIVWTQPILTIQNNYPVATLNKWNGKDIELNQDEGYILAPVIAAGKKDSNNKFTGVSIGDWSSQKYDVATDISAHTGVYGFHEGAVAFALKDDGTMFIGKSGNGRIEFNGNSGLIQSAHFNDNGTQPGYGMQINIDQGILIAKKSHNKITLDGESGAITLENSQSLDHRIKIDTAASTYPLTVGNKFTVAWDGTITATNGDFNGYIHGSEIYGSEIEGGTIYGSTIRGAKILGADFYVASKQDPEEGGVVVENEDGTTTTTKTHQFSSSGYLTFKHYEDSLKTWDGSEGDDIGRIGYIQGEAAGEKTDLLGIKTLGNYGILLSSAQHLGMIVSNYGFLSVNDPTDSNGNGIASMEVTSQSENVVLPTGHKVVGSRAYLNLKGTGKNHSINLLFDDAEQKAYLFVYNIPAENQYGVYARFA